MYLIFLTIVASMFYLLSTVLVSLRLTKHRGTHPANTASYLFPAVIGLLLHALLASQLIQHNAGINLGFFNSLCLLACLITAVSIIISFRNKLESLGLASLPISILSMILAVVFQTPAHETVLLSTTLQIHIMFSVFAYSILSIAALLSIILGIQDYQLHHPKDNAWMQAMPPLQTVESLLFKTILVGFILLTAALITGFLFTTDLFNHKILFSCIAWTVFLVLLLGRHLAGWRGKIAVRWTLGGIISLMLAFFGSKLVLEIVLQ